MCIATLKVNKKMVWMLLISSSFLLQYASQLFIVTIINLCLSYDSSWQEMLGVHLSNVYIRYKRTRWRVGIKRDFFFAGNWKVSITLKKHNVVLFYMIAPRSTIERIQCSAENVSLFQLIHKRPISTSTGCLSRIVLTNAIEIFLVYCVPVMIDFRNSGVSLFFSFLKIFQLISLLWSCLT